MLDIIDQVNRASGLPPQREAEIGRSLITMANVLITVPRLSNVGGVANYYRTIRPFLGSSIEYIEIGAAKENLGILASIIRLLSDFYKFAKELKRFRYDLVHINPSFGYKSLVRDAIFVCIAKACKVRVLVFFRGWDDDCERVVRRYFFRPLCWTLGLVEEFIVLGSEFETTLRNMRVDAPIHLETTVVDNSIFRLAVQRKDQTGTRTQTIRILYLSRLERGKGAREALLTFEILKKKYPSTKFEIAGDGEMFSDLQSLVAERGIRDVKFLGHVDGDDKASAFDRADVFFFPTFFGEGMPNCVLEAMAYGLPVVTRPVGGLADFFENTRMGFISSSNNLDEFARLLAHFVTDPSIISVMGEYNREYARSKFAASEVSARLERIYARFTDS